MRPNNNPPHPMYAGLNDGSLAVVCPGQGFGFAFVVPAKIDPFVAAVRANEPPVQEPAAPPQPVNRRPSLTLVRNDA